MSIAYTVEPITSSEFDGFSVYLNDHLADNGQPSGVYFQPLSKDESVFAPERAAAFRGALDIAVGAPGWRRLWGAFEPDGALVGHIDLRAHAERQAAHRCLLGMGVHRQARKLGLGSALIAHAEAWAMVHAALDWIDLQVLSVNQPAIRLYRRAGFAHTGEIADMFRIDGRSFDFTNMSKRIGQRVCSELDPL